MYRHTVLIVLFCCLLAVGCMPSPYYQREEAIPQNAWNIQYKPDFKFDIADTTAHYNLFFIIRHTNAYAYSNIWMWIYVKQPGDKSFQKFRVNIPLAEASGKWLGRGMGEIYEQYMPIAFDGMDKFFKKPGTYEIRLEQNMRVNPLPEVLNVGLRIEKNNKL